MTPQRKEKLIPSPFTEETLSALRGDMDDVLALARVGSWLAHLYEKLLKLYNIKEGPAGEPGRTPTDAELIELIRPLIPEVHDGKDADVNEVVEAVLERIPRAKDGEPGHTPQKGIDYFTKEDVREVVSAVLKRIPKPKNGKDGKDAVLDMEALIEAVKTSKKLGVGDIEGLTQTMRSMWNQIGKKGYLHGGGDTIRAGSGVTITRNLDGTTTISATSGGANVATEAVTAVQSGSNVTIDLTQLSQTYTSVLLVTRNGMVLTLGDTNLGYTQAGDILTIYNADESEPFLIQYTYS